MVSKKSTNDLLDNLYAKEISNEIGIDINDIRLKNYEVKINDCKNCSRRWRFVDRGLSEKNIALYVYFLDKNNIKNYCIGKGFFEESNTSKARYAICFETNTIDVLETVIRKSDIIKAIYSGKFSTEIDVNKIQQYRVLKKDDIEKIFFSKVSSNVKSRRRMWNEIDEGIRRIIGRKPNNCRTTILPDATINKIKNCRILSLHGHQLRDLIQNNYYALDANGENINVDLMMMGHYHLLMIMIRYNTIILLTGCFVGNRIGYREEFISHIGGPSLTFGKKINGIVLNRME